MGSGVSRSHHSLTLTLGLGPGRLRPEVSVEYADWMDRPLQICWQCFFHDESSNQFRKSDIKSVVQASESFRSHSVGGSGVANARFHIAANLSFSSGSNKEDKE